MPTPPEPNDVPFEEVTGIDEFTAIVRAPATGQFAIVETFKAGLSDLANRTINLLNRLATVEEGGGGGTSRNLAKANYVDIGGTGTGNIEAPFGTVAAGLANGKTTIVAPGDYSAQSAISVASNVKLHIVGLNSSREGYGGTQITTIPPITMPTVGGEQGWLTIEGVAFGGAVNVGSSLVLKNCSGVVVGPSTSTEYAVVAATDCHISSMAAGALLADRCTWNDNAEINIYGGGSACQITNSELQAGVTVTFVGTSGVLTIDMQSDRRGVTVVNGTKVLIGLAEQAVAVTPVSVTNDPEVVATLPTLPKGTGKWLIRGQFQGAVVEDTGNQTECGIRALLEVSTNGGGSWSTLTSRGVPVPDGIADERGEIGLSVGYIYTATGDFSVRLSAVYQDGTALQYDVTDGYLSATPINT